AYAIINTVNNRNAFGLRNKVNEINSTYEAGQFGSFLTNHDQDRSFSQFGQNTSKAKLAASILLSLPGVPYLYYGEEVGMIGRKPDENIRKPMQWSTENQAGFTTGHSWQAPNINFAEANVADQLLDDNSLLKHYQKWIGLRTNYPALRTGTYQEVDSSVSAVYSFLRQHQESNSTLLLVHNTSSERDTFPISLNSSTLAEGTYNLRDLITNTVIGSINVTSNGGFSGTNEALTLMAFTSYALAFEAQ
ncbi:MAG: alpha-amylase family glycosyl hydrolase, partial [Flavobacteriaceae bacterium]